MNQGIGAIFLAWLMAGSVIFGPVAAIVEKRRRKRAPETKPYAWGIYTGWMLLVGGALFAIGCFYIMLNGAKEPSFFLTLGALFLVQSLSGFFILWRRRWAWVIGAILSFVPFGCLLGWIINGVYASNRWQEMAAEAATRKAALRPHPTRQSSPRPLAAGSESPPAQDIEQQLRSLAKLRDDGLITEADFESKKKQILGI